MIKNDIIGHRKLLDDAEVNGLHKVNIPISWVRDLLSEIEALRGEADNHVNAPDPCNLCRSRDDLDNCNFCPDCGRDLRR